MKIKNKILIITLIFVAIILLGKLDCFGYSAGEKVHITCLNNDEIDVTLSTDIPSNYSDFNYYCSGKSNYIILIPNNISYFKIKQYSSEKRAFPYSSDGTSLSCAWLHPNGTIYTGNGFNYLYVNESDFNNYDSAVLSKYFKYTIYNEDDSVFFKVTPTLEETLVEGYKVAKTTIHQTTKQQIVEILPVGIVIMATLILVSLIAYFRFWRQ